VDDLQLSRWVHTLNVKKPSLVKYRLGMKLQLSWDLNMI